MLKIIDIGSTEVDLKLIRAMLDANPAITIFYMALKDIEYVRDKYNEVDPVRRLSMWINTNDPVWHTSVQAFEELDKGNVVIACSEEEASDIVIGILNRNY